MAVIEWRPELDIGIFEIDMQHRSLVSIANQLHDAIEAGKADRTIEWMLEELLLYTKMHFQTEEQYMKRYQYKEAAEHSREHGEMLKAIRRFKRRLKAGDEISDEVLEFLRNWLESHIGGLDRALGRAYAKGIATRVG